jgi:amino-acid N-acetyltransferase
VRYVREAPVRQQLDMHHLVLLTDLGVSMCGEALLCGVHDVALHAAAELKADRLIILDDGTECAASNVVPMPKVW